VGVIAGIELALKSGMRALYEEIGGQTSVSW
jgi:hypothetical protein